MKKNRRYNPPKSLLFVHEKGVELDRLQVSDEALYSITRPVPAARIEHIIRNHLKEMSKSPAQCTITDATACVGGDTLHFARFFKHVQSVEINPEHCRMLQNNVKVYNRKNVTVYCRDYLKMVAHLKQDVIFMDPPWGGPSYKHKKNVWLALSDVSLPNIVQSIAHTASLLVLKVPLNFDVSHILNKGYQKGKSVLFRSIHVYHLKKMDIIVIVTKKSPWKKTRKQHTPINTHP
jgi:predicted RNA methylase